MRQDKKEARLAAQVAQMFGIDTTLIATGPTNQRLKNNSSREAEAVLAFVESPQNFTKKSCKYCGHTFATDRANVAYCSDKCRAGALDQIGIKFDWSKSPEARWYSRFEGDKLTREPLIITEIPLQIAEQVIHSNNINIGIKEFGTVRQDSSYLSDSSEITVVVKKDLLGDLEELLNFTDL